ncbi:hypothetical protein PUR71_33195 [Streptomyces sp. SP17BM10]|uniref:hypothetical protein n=1 Tax=Streptomyces sp. SP17BM10 TaxID=3002530 RepID=UPI002E759C7C|nr:hypothetical protein [Streptomyces sp. SP17BM10]MEE1787728.1 hypothetical protein [Streptomyces sp. SP17BM10]
MRSIVAGQTAMNEDEFAELALGLVADSEFARLFTGVPGESEVERVARTDAAADVLACLRWEDPVLAAYAQRLLSMAPVPLRRPAVIRRTASVGRVAA